LSIEAIVAMQACARIGLTHSVIFGGFSAKSIQERIEDTKAKLVITADGQFRGGKLINLKSTVDEAIKMGKCESVKNVIIFNRANTKINKNKNDILWEDLTLNQSKKCDPIFVDAEHPLFILYTSGSTGKPKGVQHSTAGYLLHAINTCRWTFDLQEKDIFWCTADVGWINRLTNGS
jgi:acetyl-CoA synthetase